MSSSTPNIGLTLPIGTEKVSRQIINQNMTKIDTAFGNMNRATMRPVPFTIAVADWSGSGSSYSATFDTAYVTTTSQEILTYTASLRTAKAEDLEANKKSGGGGIVFTSKKKPVGQIEGTIYVWDTDDGKIPVIIEGTVTPIANGGTGASNVTGAKNNLGITAVENSVATLNSNMLPFDNNFGTINKSKIRQVCGTFSVTGSGTDTYVVPLSTITGGRITDNSYLIAVSLVTYDLGYIAVGTRLSSTAGNMVVKFSDNIPNNTQVSLRYLITYYTT